MQLFTKDKALEFMQQGYTVAIVNQNGFYHFLSEINCVVDENGKIWEYMPQGKIYYIPYYPIHDQTKNNFDLAMTKIEAINFMISGGRVYRTDVHVNTYYYMHNNFIFTEDGQCWPDIPDKKIYVPKKICKYDYISELYNRNKIEAEISQQAYDKANYENTMDVLSFVLAQSESIKKKGIKQWLQEEYRQDE